MSDQNASLNTELEMDATESTAISSNGQIDSVVFNMDLIAAEDPELAESIRRLYDKAKKLKPDDKLDGAEEDIALVSEVFKDLQARDS